MRRLLIALLGILLLPATAAASEGESALSAYLGYGTFTTGEVNPHGAVLGLDYERGLSDAVSLRVSGGAGLYREAGEAAYSGHATVGITYMLDVIRYVPYVNLGIGGIVIGGLPEEDTSFSALLELGAGVDILHSRSFSYGVLLRFESFIEDTSFFTAGVRATYRWGFF